MVTEARSYDGTEYPVETYAGSLQVTVDVSNNVDDPPSMAYRLRIAVTSSLNVDSSIFVFESLPDAAGRSTSLSRFVTVATPANMQELPLAEPSVDSEYYYRSDSVDLYYRTVAAIERARDEILRRINLLLENIEALTSMRSQMVVNWDFDTDEGSSVV